MRRFHGWLFFVLFLVFVLISPPSTQAHHKQMVLGEATEASELTFPQVSAGPGLITPDSPFYFLDKAYQQFRLALTNSEGKAKLRAKIAGERLAELRLMMAKNDERGINTALSEMTSEMDSAAENLSLASGQGTNIQTSAVEVNQQLKEQRMALRLLIKQAKGDLRLKLLAANESLKKSKVEVEDNLPEDQLQQEIEDDLIENIEDESSLATDSARGLEHAIFRLDELASQAAEKDKQKRAEALRHAIEVKNAALQKQQLRQEELRRKKEQALRELRELKMGAAKESREKIEQAVRDIQEAEDQEAKVLEEAESEEKELESQTSTNLE